MQFEGSLGVLPWGVLGHQVWYNMARFRCTVELWFLGAENGEAACGLVATFVSQEGAPLCSCRESLENREQGRKQSLSDPPALK